jgi:hypothetical protein
LHAARLRRIDERMLAVHVFDALIVLYLLLLPLMHRRGRRVRAELAASRTWPSAPSRVVESRLDEHYTAKGGTTYHPRVVYEFEALGARWRGQRLYFGDAVAFSLQRSAQRMLDALVADAQVRVFHDPTDATQSVIQRTAPILRRYNVLFVVMFALLGVMIVVRMFLAGFVEP